MEPETPNYRSTHPNQVQLTTEEERDNAIIRWIKPQVEDHPDFLLYTESKVKLQHLSEVIKQYAVVAAMLRQLSGLMTLIDYDGAPGCMVEPVRTNIRSMGIY